MVVEAFELDDAKTGAFRKTLGKLGIGKTALLVDGAKENRNLQLSSRNIRRRGAGRGQPGASVSPAAL